MADLVEGSKAACVFTGQELEIERKDAVQELCLERLVDYEIIRIRRIEKP